MTTTQILLVLAVLAVLTANSSVARYRRSSSRGLPWEKREQIDQPPADAARLPASRKKLPSPGLKRPRPIRATEPTEIGARPLANGTPSRRLASGGALGHTLLSILSRGDLSESDWEELEETLLVADVGLDSTTELMETLRTETKVRGTTDPERLCEESYARAHQACRPVHGPPVECGTGSR